MLVTNVYDKQGSRNTSELCNTTEYFFHFITVALKLQPFLFGKAFCATVCKHFIDALHFLYALTNGIEVGKHTTQPTFGSIRHVYPFSTFGNNFLSLFFSAHKHNLLTAAGNLLHGSSYFLQGSCGFIKVNDMYTFLLSKDVW